MKADLVRANLPFCFRQFEASYFGYFKDFGLFDKRDTPHVSNTARETAC